MLPSTTEICDAQISLTIAGNERDFECWKRVQQIGREHYTPLLEHLTDEPKDRHIRNIAELKQLKGLLSSRFIQTDMLIWNTTNSFYPSYVLHHHFNVFSKLAQGKTGSEVGAFFDQIVHIKVGESTKGLTLNSQGAIQMAPNEYFYSRVTSLLIDWACFINGNLLHFVKLRSQDGSILGRVTDLGLTLSKDYQSVGYNFHGLTPSFSIPLPNQRLLSTLKSVTAVDEFKLTLNDLSKSLHLTMRYGSMRRQFRTLPDSKEERPIITYQAVVTRILDGFGILMGFCELLRRLSFFKPLLNLVGPGMNVCHRIVLNRLLALRECCGGFGYLQASGHPPLIQRMLYRASQKIAFQVPLVPQLLRRVQFYSAENSVGDYYNRQLSLSIPVHAKIFSLFSLICLRMREGKTVLSEQDEICEFMEQCAIHTLMSVNENSRYPEDFPYSSLLRYQVASYVLRQATWLDFSKITLSRGELMEMLRDEIKLCNLTLASKLRHMASWLQIDYVRDALVADGNADQFYKRVYQSSQNNRRNDADFVNYVKQPIVEMLIANRNAKL